MNQLIAYITVVVGDYDAAIRFYTEKLDFILVEDTPLHEDKRWVLVQPRGTGTTVCCWPGQRQRNKKAGLETRQADVCFYFYKPMISPEIIKSC